ncbi:hypothetical protein, partial [Burkholderia pseudomallei]
MARGEQPPRAEDRAEADERQIGERQLFLELAVAGVGGRGPRERRGSLGIALGCPLYTADAAGDKRGVDLGCGVLLSQKTRRKKIKDK